ncbi:MAG: DUF4390 domain-containing protein [Deltaproteobacteria bacterium]|nr:DUF4390 domain-containing protein [Deltaproteobacteria bacterium]MCL5880636.1 DUF4390 domain-containing protein [Deltaproteobacteria bacterium]MDA8305147.1 DUF4390 domain-containing protein [Deltaproteobacteria bacterium]
MKKRAVSFLIRFMFPAVFAVCLFFPQKAFGMPKISDVILTSYNKNSVILYFKVNDAFNEDLKKAVLSGFPVKFRFYVKVRSEPGGRVLYDRVLINSIKYDELNNYFIIRYNYKGKFGKKLIARSFAGALAYMSKVQNLQVRAKRNFRLGRKYELTIRGVLGTFHIPFPLNYIPFLAGYFLMTTNTYSLKFIY